MDAAKLLAKHYGGKPTGSPPRITWVPQGEDAKRFGYLPDKHVVTLVDTMLGKGEDDILVFFRTTKPMDGVIGERCEACSDQLGVAHYAHTGVGENGWEAVSFKKWFIEQGMYDQPPKPFMLPDGEGGSVFVVTSNDGDMIQSTRTDHFHSFLDLTPVLEVRTGEYEETRGGPDGPTMSMTEREWKVVRGEKDANGFPDIEVTNLQEEGRASATTRFTWSEGSKKYVDVKAAPKVTLKPMSTPAPDHIAPQKHSIPVRKP